MKLCACAAGAASRQAAARTRPVAVPKTFEKRIGPPIDFAGKLDGCGRAVNPSERRQTFARPRDAPGTGRQHLQLCIDGIKPPSVDAPAPGDPPSDIPSSRAAHWKVMSRHFEISEPSPDEIVMQPRTFC